MSLSPDINILFKDFTRLKINFFENEFQEYPRYLDVKENCKLSESLQLQWDYCLIFVNGFQKDENWVVKKDDIITIRQYSSGGVAKAWESVTNFVSNAWNQTVSFFSNPIGYLKDVLKNWLLPDEEPLDNTINEKESLKQIPTLAGAKNQSGLNKTIPLILGKHLFTPNRMAESFHSICGIDGKDSYVTSAFMLGYNNIDVKDFKLGQADLASNYNGISNGFIPIDGKYNALTYDILLELRDNEELSLYPQKVVEESLNIELLNINDTTTGRVDKLILNRFSAKYPQIVELEFTINGLIGYNSINGAKEERSIWVKIEYSVDNGKTWQVYSAPTCYDINKEEITSCRWLYIGNAVYFVTRAKNEVMRFVARKEFSYTEINKIIKSGGYVEFRISRDNYKSTESSTSDNIYLSTIRTWCFNKSETEKTGVVTPERLLIEKKRKLTSRCALRIKAEDIYFKNQLDSLNCVLTSKARIWDSDSKIWSNNLYPTQNPASLMLLIMQHISRGKYIYSDNNIDLEKLGELYEWCNQERVNPNGSKSAKFVCNGVLTNQKKTRQIIDAILNTCRARLTIDNNKWSVWIDKPQEFPVMVLNNQNILSASNSKEFKDLPDGYKIKFTNERNGYQSDERKVCFNDEDENNPEAIFEDIEMLFVTDEAQIYQNGKYTLACSKLRPEVWNRKVSIDGNLLSLGCKVAVQDDTISVGIGNGAEIKEILIEGDYIIGFTCDNKFIVENKFQNYGVIITQTQSILTAPKVIKRQIKIKEIGVYSAFEFIEPISLNEAQLPCIGDIISFGIYEKISTDALVMGKKDNGDGTFDLTLYPYQEGVYTADSGDIPEFDSKVTAFTENSVVDYEPKTATIDDLISTVHDVSLGLAPSQYTFDISPELQSMPTTNDGKIFDDWIYIDAFLYYKDVLVENAIYKATIDNAEVGEWNGNTVKISSSYLKGDKLEVKLKATTEDGYVRYATATISKLYAGKDLVLYKMLFPDGEKIKVSPDFETYTPSKINVFKRKVTAEGETETEYGRITIESIPNESEQNFQDYLKIENETYNETIEYYGKYRPIFLQLDEQNVLSLGNDIGAVFYERIKE